MSDTPPTTIKESEETTIEKKSAQPRTTALWTAILLLFVCVLGLGGYVYYQQTLLNQRLEAVEPELRKQLLATMAQELDIQLEDRLQAWQSHVDALLHDDMDVSETSSPAEVARFNLQQETIDHLQQRLDALEQRAEQLPEHGPQAFPQWQELSRLSTELQAMQRQLDHQGANKFKAIQLLTAFDRLEEKLLANEQYAQALSAFILAAEGMEPLKKWQRWLAPMQFEGIASYESLAAMFDAAQDVSLSKEAGEAQKNSFLDHARANLASFITIRKVGPVHSGNDPGSILARAEFALQQRQLTTARDEILTLPESMQVYFSDFLDAVRDRERALSTLEQIRARIQAQVETQVMND